jgi:trimethylamine--corrinoid protein Co-methyltransferase
MTGGSYQPLSAEGVHRIHQAALDALENIGLSDAPPSGIKYMTGAGAMLGSDGRLRFPRALIEDTISAANRSITLSSRDGKNDLDLSGRKVHYGTAGAAVHVVDVESRNYRESTVQDLFNAARLVDKLDNIHFLQRPMVCRDILDNREMDLNTLYACCAGTTKHVGISFTEELFAKDGFKLLHMIAGGEEKWRERPFVSNSPFERRSGRRNSSCPNSGRNRASRCGMFSRSSLCKRHKTEASSDFWHLAICLRSAHRCHVRR